MKDLAFAEAVFFRGQNTFGKLESIGSYYRLFL